MLCQCLRFQAQQALLPGGLISAVAPEDPNWSSQTHRTPSRGWRNASGAGIECPATAAGTSAATAGRCRTVSDGFFADTNGNWAVGSGQCLWATRSNWNIYAWRSERAWAQCISVYCFLDETEYQSCDVPKPWLPKLPCLLRNGHLRLPQISSRHVLQCKVAAQAAGPAHSTGLSQCKPPLFLPDITCCKRGES